MVQHSERFLKRKLETVNKVSRWYFELLELERTVSRLMNPHPTTTSTCYTVSETFSETQNSNLSATFSETQNSNSLVAFVEFWVKVAFDRNKKSTSGLC